MPICQVQQVASRAAASGRDQTQPNCPQNPTRLSALTACISVKADQQVVGLDVGVQDAGCGWWSTTGDLVSLKAPCKQLHGEHTARESRSLWDLMQAQQASSARGIMWSTQ